MSKKLAAICAVVAPFMLGFTVPALADPPPDESFTATGVITVPGGVTSFDISFVDPQIGYYFLADSGNAAVDKAPTTTPPLTATQLGVGQFVGVQNPIRGTPPNDVNGPNGVITANNHTEVWAGDGVLCSNHTSDASCTATITQKSRVQVIDIATGAVTHTIPTGGVRRSDELCEDPQHHLVMIANDNEQDNFVTFIDTKSYRVIGTIKFDGNDPNAQKVKATGGIEQCQWSPRTNKIYLNIPEVNGNGITPSPGAVLMINPASMKVEKVFSIPLGECQGPAGMAIGPDRQILIGCSTSGPGSVIIDELSGGVVHSLPGQGSDEVWYNPGDNQYFLAASGPALLGVVDPDGEQDAFAKTAIGSHSVAADPVTRQVYVPIRGQNALCGTLTGCIAVYTATGDDPGICVVEGAPVVEAGAAGPVFLRAVCPVPLRKNEK